MTRRSVSHALHLALLAPVLAFASPAAAQLLQVDAALRLRTDTHETRRTVVAIEPGPATLAITARNLRGDAVSVGLVFDYRLPRDMIAFDEVIDRIEVSTETPQGEVFFQTTIDTDEIPLNPNRVPLSYRVTLYHPTETPSYRVRVRVYGNYE